MPNVQAKDPAKDLVKSVPNGGAVAIPPGLADRMREDAGKGVSSRPEDNLIPLIGVLQPMSKACNPGDPAYVRGAVPGAFILKNSPVPLIAGDEGIAFIPAASEFACVEWRPRKAGGGFIGKHRDRPDDVEEVPDPENPQRVRLVRRGTRHEIIETRYRYGLAVLDGFGALPFAIPFFGSGHTVARSWETQMNAMIIPDTSLIYPSFAFVYRLRTRQKSNALGAWHQIDFGLERAVTEAEYFKAKAMNAAFAKAELNVDAAQAADIEA